MPVGGQELAKKETCGARAKRTATASAIRGEAEPSGTPRSNAVRANRQRLSSAATGGGPLEQRVVRLLRNKPPDDDQDYRNSRECKLELYGVLSNKTLAVGDANDCGRQQALVGKPKEVKG
jgi:hypothetical protein